MSAALPIDALHQRFMAALLQGTPVVVTAPTGSGKSTRLPLWLAAAQPGPVLVVEPRRVACRALASYLADQDGSPLGSRIGYKVRFEERCSAETVLLFVTTGVALRLLQSAVMGAQWPYAAVLIDEVHERRWEVDLLLALARGPLAQVVRGPLVLTSATIDATALAEPLGAQVLHAEGRTFPVDTSYDATVHEPSERQLEERVCAAVLAHLEDAAAPPGDILVFLPGKGEIGGVQRALRSRVGDVELVALHSGVPLGALMPALAASSRRRVFLATNIAETSLTLASVSQVIDSGLVRRVIHRGGRTALALVAIARDAADQRSGRAGRVRPGRCLRLWSAAAALAPQTAPEVESMEMEPLLLQGAACGVSPADLVRLAWLTPLPAFAVQRATQRLTRVGAFDPAGRLTVLGQRLAETPVQVAHAMLLIGAPPPLRALLTDLVALLELGRDLFVPVPRQDAAGARAIVEARETLFGACKDEVQAQLTALRAPHGRSLGLNLAVRDEARRLADLLAQGHGWGALRRGPPGAEWPPPGLVAHLLQAWPAAGFVLRPRAQNDRRRRGGDPGALPWANGEIELRAELYQPPFPPGPQQARPSSPPKAAVILAHAWLGGRHLQVQGVGRMLLPCSERDLAAAGLGQEVVRSPVVRREQGGVRVYGEVARVLAEVVLTCQESVLRGAALRMAVAELMGERRLFSKHYEALLDGLHWWRLAAALLSPAPSPPPETLTEYLVERLTRMGVEAPEDVDLLSGEDFLPDLATLWARWPDEVRRFCEDFPRRWSLDGVQYQAWVDPKAQKVYLEPCGGAVKGAALPDARRLPSFRGFRVAYRKASRVVELR